MAEGPLFLDDKAIAKKLGLEPSSAAAVFTVLERDGFPRRNPLFHDKRFWPAVVRFFELTEMPSLTYSGRGVPSAKSKERLS